MSAVRAFVAIELAPEFAAALVRAGELLRSTAPAWAGEKWVAEANLHVTLQFLGNVDETMLECLADALAPRLRTQQRFELRLAGIGTAPSARKASMVWATLADEPPGAIAAIAAIVADEAALIGLEREHRAFTPHITIVRSRKPKHLPAEALTCADEFARHAAISMSVRSATLIASTLTRRGPIYEPLARWELS